MSEMMKMKRELTIERLAKLKGYLEYELEKNGHMFDEGGKHSRWLDIKALDYAIETLMEV